MPTLLAIKLNTLLKEGKIPEDCMYYKFIDNTTSFAMVDSTSASTFQWDDEVCEFFDTIKFLGGERRRISGGRTQTIYHVF